MCVWGGFFSPSTSVLFVIVQECQDQILKLIDFFFGLKLFLYISDIFLLH